MFKLYHLTNCLVSLYGKTKPSIASYSPPLRVVQPSASRRAALSNFGLYFPVKTDQTVSNRLIEIGFLATILHKMDKKVHNLYCDVNIKNPEVKSLCLSYEIMNG